MASSAVGKLVDDDDDDYISAEDEDFAPEDGNASSESDSEEDGVEATAKKGGKGKVKATEKNDKPIIDHDEVEGLMQDAGKKKRKRKGGDGDDSGGEGGLVKTRSMAAAQKEEKKKTTLASDAGATIDVDALWKSMNEASLRPSRKLPPPVESSPSKLSAAQTASAEQPDGKGGDNDMMTITESYAFAGQTHTRTIQVPRDSEQARLHMEKQSKEKLGPDGKPLRRPLRRISPYDPNPEGIVKNMPDPNNPFKKAVDSKNKNKGPKHRHGIPKVKQPTKLNVVDKSKLDWVAHVDATGARDELDAAQRAKDNYLEQRDFLDRVEGRTEEARAAAKVK